MHNEQEAASLTSGEFGRLSQLSRKALRLYDDRGILVPVRTDPETGYRYYSRDQVKRARLIRLLRAMDMPLARVSDVLAIWEDDSSAAERLVRAQTQSAEKHLQGIQIAAKILLAELKPDEERTMTFEMMENELGSQMVASIRRHISVPDYHEWIQPALQQLWDHISANGAEANGDSLALYYGPVNEEDDGPVEICVPFKGSVIPSGEIKVRELPAHKAIQLRTYGEYNEYPKLLEMWNAVGRYVSENGLEPNWDYDMTTYEIWHEDCSMTIGWPVREFKPVEKV